MLEPGTVLEWLRCAEFYSTYYIDIYWHNVIDTRTVGETQALLRVNLKKRKQQIYKKYKFSIEMVCYFSINGNR